MKKALNHLPQKKQEELNRITSHIRNMCNDIEMVILFGSYARGNWKEESDLKPDRKSGHKSDYDILVVTKEKATAKNGGIWHQITQKCDRSRLSTHTRIIAHDIQYLNIKLAEGQYFFKDIRKEGCLLYDSGNYRLARKRKLKINEQRRLAEEYFDNWFENAKGFYRFFEVGMEEKNLKGAAFQLHQATEACYKTILLVFTGYTPQEHYLGLLGDIAARQNTTLLDIFPRKTDEDEERFRLLDYAYIGARYDPNYCIAKEDLEYLSERVRMLMGLTEKISKAKIRSFTNKTKQKG